MSTLLYALGRWSYRHPWRVLVAWLLLIGIAGGGAAVFNTGTDNSFTIPGTESQAGIEQLNHTFPQASGTSAQYIVVAADGDTIDSDAYESAIEDSIAATEKLDGVLAVTDPFDPDVTGLVNDDDSAAIVRLQFDGQASDVPDSTKEDLQSVTHALEEQLPDGAQVALGGDLFAIDVPGVSVTELIGLLIALLVLIVTFRSFVVAGLPLLTAVLGVGLSLALIFIATAFAPISSTTPLLALMLGLAVGIDYALFIVARHQDQVRRGVGPEESVARAVGTAGSAVIFAGTTVLIALIGLGFAGIPFLTTMGIAAAVAVALAVLVALTLTPAMLGFVGGRVVGWRMRSRKRDAAAHPAAGADADADHADAASADDADADADPETAPDAERPADGTVPGDAAEPAQDAGVRMNPWVKVVTKHPIITSVAVVLGLGLLAIPAGSLALALPNAGMLPEDNEARQSYDLVSEYFGPGFNGPLILTGTIVTSDDPVTLMDDLADEVAKVPGVHEIALATPNESADTGIIQVIPDTAPDAPATADLVRELRAHHDEWLDEYGVDLLVTGFTAVGIDISDRLGGALLPFGIFVVGLSLVLLAIVFRSLWVPLKAALGYLLSVGAAFGVVSIVFEFGIGADLLGVTKVGPVISFMPIVLMGVLFGLAMDYEVFLVSRMREDFVHSTRTGRDRAITSVRTGFSASARVVTAAGLIMFFVFAAFVPEGDSSIKPIALGLAVGILADAFLVRMTLVPAVMALLGTHAWWMPAWLARRLPHFDIEGEAIEREIALTDWPEPDTTAAVVAEDLALESDSTVVFEGVTMRVEPGASLIVTAADPLASRALLLSVAGRMAPTGGRMKVAGHLVPERNAWVRTHVDVALLAGSDDPVGELGVALRGRARIVVVDGIDSVVGADRDQVAALLRDAHDVSVIASAADRHTATELLADTGRPAVPVVALSRPGSRRAPASAPAEVIA